MSWRDTKWKEKEKQVLEYFTNANLKSVEGFCNLTYLSSQNIKFV